MPSFPMIHLESASDGLRIIVRRDDGVPDEFWLFTRAEWGSNGRSPSRSIEVPVEKFLARVAWLGPACRRYRVGIDWDDHARQLVQEAQREHEELRATLASPPSIVEPGEIEERLESTRFVRRLRQFQLRDIARLIGLRHGANFSVPGAGKTAVTYALYEALREAGRVEQMLVVAPLSAYDAWFEEIEKCLEPVPLIIRFETSARPHTEILLVNYQRLIGYYGVIAQWVSSRPTHVVLDEAHRMKRGRAGQWGTACLDLAYLAERRDILTGTPAPQSPLDLEALINYLWPNQARRILPSDALVPRPLPDAARRMGDVIAPLFVRTTKDELQLPPVSYRVEQIQLSGIHRDIYNALVDQYAGQFVITRRDRVALVTMGRITMYLLEAATNPALLPVGSSRFDSIEFHHPPLQIPEESRLADLLAEYGKYETPQKLIRLAELVASNSAMGRKTLVWSNFVRNLETLRRMLARLEPALIHGGILSSPSLELPGPTREKELHRFRHDPNCMVLLANPAAMSEGVSLHDVCHDAIYVERTFNAGQYLQSVDRIHRLGLTSEQETRITFLLSAQTVDEVVDSRVHDKAERLSQMLQDPGIITMALPDDEDYGPVVDTDQDVVALLRHLRGEDSD